MSRVFVVMVAILATASSKQQKLSTIADPQAQSTAQIAAIEFEGDYSAHGGKKYSSSAELTSLAHSSAQQAKTAVRNQQTAGLQAALGAQTGYARAALEAAAAAQVALVAKQVIVQNIEKDIEHAAHQLQAEEAQYQQSLQAANAAQNAAQQSQQQLSATTAALAAVQQAVAQTERAAAAASSAAASQHQMIQDAQQRLARLHEKLHAALGGLEETKISAQKATAAAQIAQSNAAASAQLAVVNSASNQIDEHGAHEYHH
ncbi:FYVE and coiled-coil domain-containing protein 1-like [Tribolium madens]|uniref:FYVE and coiled-coil domain-containing protein 1-like n=1 Tax=Tribolium madens TaxID=41895 RepID=UPI001CF7487E|nr:FYVE and coiled-coil domain-containing protein 1-like [Tribolium madens]